MSFRPVKRITNDFLTGYDAHANLRRFFMDLGLRAEAAAKKAVPFDEGHLRAATNWAMLSTNTRKGQPIAGRLANPLRYARRQEWEHRSRSFWMYGAILAASKELEVVLGSAPGVEVWIGAGGRGGAKYGGNGISGNPAMSSKGAFTYTESDFQSAGGMQGSQRVF